jgi:hypothetical protein
LSINGTSVGASGAYAVKVEEGDEFVAVAEDDDGLPDVDEDAVAVAPMAVTVTGDSGAFLDLQPG